jgi:hypothetical protein
MVGQFFNNRNKNLCFNFIIEKNKAYLSMIYGELGRYPIEIDVKMRIISFWTKLCCGKESKLSTIIYKL